MEQKRFGDTNCPGITGNQQVLTHSHPELQKLKPFRCGLQHTQLHLGLEESVNSIWMDIWYVWFPRLVHINRIIEALPTYV